MSADLLQRAAEMLRERAERATPGPWGVSWSAVRDTEQYAVAAPKRPWDAAHIATLHPGIGLALADVLDLASLAAGFAELDAAHDGREHTIPEQYLTLARAILGEPT